MALSPSLEVIHPRCRLSTIGYTVSAARINYAYNHAAVGPRLQPGVGGGCTSYVKRCSTRSGNLVLDIRRSSSVDEPLLRPAIIYAAGSEYSRSSAIAPKRSDW